MDAANEINDGVWEIILELIYLGDGAAVVALLGQYAGGINARGPGGNSALHFATSYDYFDHALLLNLGADSESVDDTGETPIINASRQGHLEVVKLLHTRGGANLHHVDNLGRNALHYAAWRDHLPVCEFLLSKGVDLMARASDGRTALAHYGFDAIPPLSPEIAALRCAALEAASARFQQTITIEAQRSTIEALSNENALLKSVSNATLLFSDTFSDLVFVCPGGERIHAHRNILSACSLHARALLQGPWAENADERVAVVQVPQSAPAVRALLRFLYTCEVDAAALETCLSDMLELASQHEQPALISACERHAIAALSVGNVVPILVAAHLHDLAALKTACVDLIKANTVAVLMSTSFMMLETERPLLWRELRAALGLSDEEEKEGEEVNRKHARHEN